MITFAPRCWQLPHDTTKIVAVGLYRFHHSWLDRQTVQSMKNVRFLPWSYHVQVQLCTHETPNPRTGMSHSAARAHKASRSPYNYIDRLPMDNGSCKPACKVHTDSMQAQPACSTREDPWDDGSNCNADQPRLDRSNGQEGRRGLSVWCSSVGGFNRLLQPQSAAAISITNTSF